MTLDTKFVLFAAFNAGGLVVGLRAAFREGARRQKETEQQLNGVGRKVGGLTALLVLWADTDEKRKQLAEVIKPK